MLHFYTDKYDLQYVVDTYLKEPIEDATLKILKDNYTLASTALANYIELKHLREWEKEREDVK